MIKSLKKQKGFTLLEILIAIGVFLIILIPLFNFERDIFYNNSFVQKSLLAEQESRRVLKNIISELRTSSSSNNGSYPIVLASSTAITFFSDINDDGLKEQIRYFLDGTTLKKGVIKPSGQPYQYITEDEEIFLEVNNISPLSTDIFEYYDDSYSGTTSPLSLPINIPEIRLVKITLMVEADPNRPPAPLYFTSQVSIRNLKDNL